MDVPLIEEVADVLLQGGVTLRHAFQGQKEEGVGSCVTPLQRRNEGFPNP